MARFFPLIALLTSVVLTIVAQAQNPRSADSSSEEIPQYSGPANAPCVDQPRSRSELAASFQRGRFPQASQIDGTWVEIGLLTRVYRSFDCSGEKRGSKFEFVLVAKGYSVELKGFGMTYPQKVTMEPDHKGSIEFQVDFAADEGPDTYRCRLTERDTLACLIDQRRAVEFKKMTVKPEQIWEVHRED
jgi:hypothetical protein